MSLPDDLPVSESLAVFLGVTGFQWLTEGRAGLLLPLSLASHPVAPDGKDGDAACCSQRQQH